MRQSNYAVLRANFTYLVSGKTIFFETTSNPIMAVLSPNTAITAI